MKGKFKLVCLTAGLGLGLTVLCGQPRADDLKPATPPADVFAALAEAGKPGAEHARLKPLAGSWTYTARFWMDPGRPPIETHGTIERRWILGGRFLEERVIGTGFDGKPGFEGFGLIGFDNGQKVYTSTFACTMGTGVSTGVGTADASGAINFQKTCSCPLEKRIVHGRDVLRVRSDDTVVLESYMNDDGKEVKVMEIVSVRKK